MLSSPAPWFLAFGQVDCGQHPTTFAWIFPKSGFQIGVGHRVWDISPGAVEALAGAVGGSELSHPPYSRKGRIALNPAITALKAFD